MNTRDKNGYPLEGIDVVPIRPKKPNKMTELMKLLQGANRREEKERENADYWRRAYHRVNQDYIALQPNPFFTLSHRGVTAQKL